MKNEKVNIKNYLFILEVVVLSIVMLSIVLTPTFAYAKEAEKILSSEETKQYLFDTAWHLGEKGMNTDRLFNDIYQLTNINVNTEKSDVVVAVIDTGCDATNPFFEYGSFWKNELEVNGKPNVDDDNNGVVDDFNGINTTGSRITGNFKDATNTSLDATLNGSDWHGTHVCGLIHQIAPNVKIMPICAARRVGNGAGEFNAADVIIAILYAVQNGADIINMSFGTTGTLFYDKKISFNYMGKAYDMSLNTAIQYAFDNGVLVVAAAGNDASRHSFYPALCDHVISVMGSNIKGEFYFKSNYNDDYTICAPGENILSTVGKGIQGDIPGKHPTIPSNIVGIGYKHGTSMASPIVAGFAALLLSVSDYDNATDLIPYITNKNVLSKLDSKKKLSNENVLLDYAAANRILNNVISKSNIQVEDGVIVKNQTYYDNEKVVLEPNKIYKGDIAWFKDNKLVSQNSKFTFMPTKDCVIELKVDGRVVERYVITVKSYKNYLITIICSVVGGVLGLSLIITITVVLVKKKKRLKNLS